METNPKDIGVLIGITPELKAWVDSQAADIGLNGPYAASIWIAMLVFQTRKRQERQPEMERYPLAVAPVIPQLEAPQMPVAEEDQWRGPVEDEEPSSVDLDTVVAARLAEAEQQGLTQPAEGGFLAPVASVPGVGAAVGNVRPLRRPAPKYSPATQPNWMGQ